MRLIIVILSLLLGLSVALNIYYYFLVKPLPNIAPVASIESIKSAVPNLANKQSSEPVWYLDAKHAFENHQFEVATRFTTLIDRANPHKVALFEEWYNQASNWLTDGDYASFIAFEQSFLKFYPNDRQVLLLSAQKELRTQSVNAGIGAYYELLDQPMADADKEAIRTQLQQIITQHIQNLKDAHAWQVLQSLSETLINYEPNNIDYILTMAESYAQQQDQALTEFALGLLPYAALSDARISQIRNLLQTDVSQTGNALLEPSPNSQAQANNVSQVDLIKSGEHYIVETLFNDQHAINLLIDTGASTTTLSNTTFERYFKRRDTRYLGQYTLNTANGLTQAPVYQIKNVSVGDYVLDNIAVVVLPLEHMREAEGLLGMNVLRAFDFRIDQTSATLLLSPRQEN